MIAASLLLLLEEEDAFWMMCTIVEDLLPASYYSSTLLGKIYSFLFYVCVNLLYVHYQVCKLTKEFFVIWCLTSCQM